MIKQKVWEIGRQEHLLYDWQHHYAYVHISSLIGVNLTLLL